VDSSILGRREMKKITVGVDRYSKADSFESSFVARPTTSPELQRARCLSALKDEPTSDVLKRALDDLSNDHTSDPVGRLVVTPFIAEELSRISDAELKRYIEHRYRYDVFPAAGELDAFPPYVQIEPTSVCNFRCIFCYQTDETFSSRDSEHMGSMSFDAFRNIVDQIEGHVEFVSLASRGEPLMCRDLPAMLDFARGKFLNLKVNTNASILTEERSHALLSGAVRTVVFSADAAEEPLYSKLRVNGKLERVLRNIERFETIRQKHYPEGNVITRVSGVYVSEDQDMNKMIQLWGGMVDEISFVRYNPWENVYEARPSQVVAPCSDLWRRMFIWFDGRVNPCDTDYKSVLSVGSVNSRTVSEIWTGREYSVLRRSHLEKRRSDVHPCNKCVVV